MRILPGLLLIVTIAGCGTPKHSAARRVQASFNGINLIDDGGFEGGTAGFYFDNGSGTLKTSGDQPLGGAASLQAQFDNDADLRVTLTFTPPTTTPAGMLAQIRVRNDSTALVTFQTCAVAMLDAETLKCVDYHLPAGEMVPTAVTMPIVGGTPLHGIALVVRNPVNAPLLLTLDNAILSLNATGADPGTPAGGGEVGGGTPMDGTPMGGGTPITPIGGGMPTRSGVIGADGIAAFDATAHDRIASVRSFFQHQSVGGNLSEGVKADGFDGQYITSTDEYANHPTGGYIGETLFTTSNSHPLDKIAEFQAFAAKIAPNVDTAGFKFGYADIESTQDLAAIKTAYSAMVAALRPLRIYHVTPPLTYDSIDSTGVDQNDVKLQFAAWMKSTFAGDVIFDLQDAESTSPTGARCTDARGVWTLCVDYRKTMSDPDGPPDEPAQGHLNPDAAARIAKAYLYALLVSSGR